MSAAPFLVLTDAVIATDDGTAGPLSLSLSGPRAVIIGQTEPLLGPLFRRARVTSGAFQLLGQPLDEVNPAQIGLAPLEPTLPLRLTPADYVRWSARLAGVPAREALPLAQRLCASVGLGSLANSPLGSLPALHRRLAVLAHALVTSPALLVAEAPLAGLDPSAAHYLLQALGYASQGRCILLSSTAPTPGSLDAQLADGADERLTLGDTDAA